MKWWVLIIIIFFSLMLLWIVYTNYSRYKLNKSKLFNNFDKNIVSGTWYQHAFLPNWFQKECIKDINATYTSQGDWVKVTNKCTRSDSSIYTINGSAYFYDNNKIKVTFGPKFLAYVDKFLQEFGDLNFSTGDYYIVDSDNKNYLVTGSSDLRYLWILVKEPDYFSRAENDAQYRRVLSRAADLYYDVSKLVITTNDKK